jgi:hypothetical protein
MVDEPFQWSQIESADYRVYVQNLRDVGCPEATIRDMITAEVDELFVGRVRDLVNPHVPQFWNLLASKETLEALVEAKGKELNELGDQRTEMLRLLLGKDGQDFVEGDNEAGEAAEAERQRQLYGFLPAGKRDQLIALEQKYQVLAAEVHQGKLKPEEKQLKLAELNEAKKLERSQLLTPDELAELRIRTSKHADLRYRLAGFRASEDEIKALVGVYEKYASAQESKEPNVDVRVAQRAEAQRQQHEELLALLGEGRLAEFERAQNNDYQQLYRLGNSLSLSQDEVSGLYEQHRQAEELARQWRADKNLSAEERSARLTELRDRLEDDFRTRLGPANYEIFRQQGPGHWIQGLQ